MFAEWVSRGAEIGVVAFFAVIVFALLGVALYGVFSVAARIAMPEKKDINKTYRDEGRY